MTGTEMIDAIAHIDEDLIEGCLDRMKACSSEKKADDAAKKGVSGGKEPAGFKRAAMVFAALAAVAVIAVGLVSILHIGGKSPKPIDPAVTASPAPTEAPTPGPTEASAVPEGYNEHDYLALLAFLETESEGKTNGERLNPSYRKENPATWTYKRWDDTCELAKWDEEGYLTEVYALVESYELAGTLDLSGCERLDEVSLSSESKLALDVTDCPLKKGVLLRNYGEIELLSDPIVTPCLNVSPGIAHLHWIAVPDEAVNGNFYDFELELLTEGKGTVGINMHEVIGSHEFWFSASAASGWHFVGWYDENGQVVSQNETLDLSQSGMTHAEGGRIVGSYSFTARFEEGRPVYVENFNHSAYIEAMTRLLSGESADEIWYWDNKTCDVIFVLDDDAFRAYEKLTMYPVESGGSDNYLGVDGYETVYSDPVAEYPREVGETALQRLYREIPEELGFDWGDGKYVTAEGFAGEDWFLIKTVDDNLQDIQFHCIFVKGADGEWREVPSNDKELLQPIFGACMLDENTGFLCYNGKFLDEPDETYRRLYVYRTEDGGKTWLDTGLELPEEYGTVHPGSCLSPVFSGDHGAMFVNAFSYDESIGEASYEGKQLKLWYETWDGGKTWILHDEKEEGPVLSGVASWPVDTDGDGEDEFFCVNVSTMQIDSFSSAWLEDGSGQMLGTEFPVGTASAAQGTYAIVESPEYGACIMRLMPEYEGQTYGYILYKCVSGELAAVYAEIFWNYGGEEGERIPTAEECADYERRVNELLSTGRILFSCDIWGALRRDFYDMETGESLMEALEGKRILLSTYGSAGQTALLRDYLADEQTLILDSRIGYHLKVEPFYGTPTE